MKSIIPLSKLEELIQVEPALILLFLPLIAWICYKLFLGALTTERHNNLQGLFQNVFSHLVIGSVLIVIFLYFDDANNSHSFFYRMRPFIGLLGLGWGAIVFIKTSKIFLFEYLFIGHMKEGVPLLLVNIFTLILSVLVFGWIGVAIFGLNVTPLLTTFGVASVVLGLALQDTLGNLFAGISMQFDTPYEIGDWIEVVTSSQRVVGQVYEISWRATVLTSWTEEFITVPNRTMAQSQVMNFSPGDKPIIRSQSYRIPYQANINEVRVALLNAANATEGVRATPAPSVLISETTDSWLTFKVVIFIDDFGKQYSIFDKLNENTLASLTSAGISMAATRLQVLTSEAS